MQARRTPDGQTPIVAPKRGLGRPTSANSTTQCALWLETISAGDVQRGTFKRKRGRRAAAVPSTHHLEVLKATKSQTHEEVAAQCGVSRQRVGQIAKRWKPYLPVRPLGVRDSIRNVRQNQTPRARKNKICVISFRVTAPEARLLKRRYPQMKSVNCAAREIVSRVLSIGNPTQ
jgi:hypothetical protein